MKKNDAFALLVHMPYEKESKQTLAKQVAKAHAAYIINVIERLPCPPEQKLALLQRILHNVKSFSPPNNKTDSQN